MSRTTCCRVNETRLDAVCYLDFITNVYVALINQAAAPLHSSRAGRGEILAYRVMQTCRTYCPRCDVRDGTSTQG